VTAFFFALLLLILYSAFLILTPFLTAITWAAILAILFYPVYAGLLELMRGRATLAAMTVIVVITIIVIAPGVELARFLADEAVSLLQSVRLILGPALFALLRGLLDLYSEEYSNMERP
jgi:predicted PurR-regulated permease PerM